MVVKAYSATGKRCLVMVLRSWRSQSKRVRTEAGREVESSVIRLVSCDGSPAWQDTRLSIRHQTNLDQGQVEPEALSLSAEVSTLLESLLHEGEVRSLEQACGRSDGIRRVGDDDIEGVLDGGKVLETVSDVDGDLGVSEDRSHTGEVDGRDSGDGLLRWRTRR